MTDIVERMRAKTKPGSVTYLHMDTLIEFFELVSEAADEVERLQTDLAAARRILAKIATRPMTAPKPAKTKNRL